MFEAQFGYGSAADLVGMGIAGRKPEVTKSIANLVQSVTSKSSNFVYHVLDNNTLHCVPHSINLPWLL